jgi:hypothetical protein
VDFGMADGKNESRSNSNELRVINGYKLYG